MSLALSAILAPESLAAASPTPDSVASTVLSRWLEQRSDTYSIKVVPAAEAARLPADAELVARPIAAGVRPAARMQLWVDVRVAGKPVRALPVAFEVHARRSAWVATRDLRVGETLDPAALVHETVDLAAVTSDLLAVLPRDARLRRPLLAGQAIAAGHIETMPAVQRGMPVTVQTRVGAIGVEARAEALQDGQAGAEVWIRLATATGPVRARVIGIATVEVIHE